jgi:hypothetical protein
MSLLSALMVKIGADSSGLRKELKTAKRDIDRTFSKDPVTGFGNAISNTTASVSNLISKFNTAAMLVGGGFGLTALIGSAVSAGAAVHDLALKLHVSNAEAAMFSRTVKLAGGDVETAGAAMMRLDSTISGSGEKAEKTRAILDALGVSLTDQTGKLLPLNEQVKNLSVGYQKALEAGYGQEFLMNTLGVRGMALAQTLLKYTGAAEDAAKIKSIGLDADQMEEVNRQLQLTQAQLGQLTMAGGALLAPIVGELLPGITEGLAETARMISENKAEIVSFGTTMVELMVTWKAMQAISRAMDWAGSFRTAAAEVQVLTKAQEAAITRRLNMLKAAQKKEEQMLAKEVAAQKIAEAEKEKAINEGCVRIQMKYAETAARIEAEMRSAFRKISAEAQMSAAGQVQAIAATGTAAQAASTKMVAASTVAKGAVGSLTKTVWALVGGWYAVAAAIAFAFEKLVEFKQEKSKEITGDTYVGEQRYRKGADGAFYRQTINTEAEDAFDTYTETKVTDEEELAAVRAAYIQKHPTKKSSTATAVDTDKYKNLFSGGGDSGGGKGSSGKATDPLKEELEKRKKLQNSLEKEYAARMTIKEAMQESKNLQTAYLSASEKAVYKIAKDHEKTVDDIKKRWFQFETEYIGMSDEDRAKFVQNLSEMGVAFEVTENGKLSLAKQVAADIAAANKQYDDAIVEYHAQCKDILADIDEAYRNGSVEKLKAALTEANTYTLNAYKTRQTVMERYYENWLESHKTTSEMVADIILESQNTFETFFKNVLTGQKSFGDAFMDLLNGLLNDIVGQISKMMASALINKFLSTFFGGAFGFADGGLVRGYATGGPIYGPGTSTSDSIPAMLSAGEYVVKADAVRRIGVPILDAINSGMLSRYAAGGTVTGSFNPSAASKGGVNVSIHLTNESGQQLQAEQTGSSFNGEEYVIGVVLKAVSTNQGGLRSMIKGVATT